MVGKFIVIDGTDQWRGHYVRKLTQENALMEAGVVFTYDPGMTKVAKAVRSLLQEVGPSTSALSRMLLEFAARNSDYYGTILPALNAGKHVISNGFDASTAAFEVFAAGRPDLRKNFQRLRGWVVEERGIFKDNNKRAGVPDAYIFLELRPALAFERARSAARSAGHPEEAEPLEYYERAQGGFDRFIADYGGESKMISIDADHGSNFVYEELRKAVLEVLELETVSAE